MLMANQVGLTFAPYHFSSDIVRLRNIGIIFARKMRAKSAAKYFVVWFVGDGCDKKFFMLDIQILGLSRNE
jgi:hypothetical protein